MMSLVSAGDLFSLGRFAWRLWELGFSKAKGAERQYAEFGADVQHLARSLEKLGQVIENVTGQLPASMSENHKWDLKSLPQICGDFSKTLKDCEKLLNDNTKFGRGRGGFVYNIQWNLSIEPEVTRLRDRVAFHNVKIATILKPLEIKLLVDLKIDLRNDLHNIHSDLASRITEVHEMIRNLPDRTSGELNSTDNVTAASSNIIPTVPEYLEEKFEIAVKLVNQELQDGKKFPLARGIDAFHHHFEDSTCKFQPKNTSMPGDFFAERTPEPTQYLNLMKSIWVLQKIKKGDEYAEALSDPLWELYVRELDERCLREYHRFTVKEPPRDRLKEPDRRNLDLLREEEFRIWLVEEENNDDFQPGTDCLNEILHVSLLSTIRNGKLELVLLRQSDTKLEMQTISSKTTGPPNRQATITDVSLRKAQLVPLYANPRSAPQAMNIVFKPNETTERSSALSFVGLKDLLAFQQAITGYKVVYDEADIHLLTYMSSSVFKGKKVQERGRIQIWNPRLLERSKPIDEQGEDLSRHRKSIMTDSSNAPSFGKSFSTAYTSPVQSEGSRSYSFQKPDLPILVLYLEPDPPSRGIVSYLSLLMDESTNIHDGVCSCGGKRESCIHSTIERPKELIAWRVQAESDNDELNLAKIGRYQKPKVPGPTRESVKGMKWTQISFETPNKRTKFEEMFNDTKEIYRKKLCRYYEEMRETGRDHQGLGMYQ